MGTGAGLNRALGSNGSGALLTVQALDDPRKPVDEVVQSRTPLGGRAGHFYLRRGARAARSGHLRRAGGGEDLEHSQPVVVRRRSFKKGLKRAGGSKDRGFMSPKKIYLLYCGGLSYKKNYSQESVMGPGTSHITAHSRANPLIYHTSTC